MSYIRFYSYAEREPLISFLTSSKDLTSFYISYETGDTDDNPHYQGYLKHKNLLTKDGDYQALRQRFKRKFKPEKKRYEMVILKDTEEYPRDLYMDYICKENKYPHENNFSSLDDECHSVDGEDYTIRYFRHHKSIKDKKKKKLPVSMLCVEHLNEINNGECPTYEKQDFHCPQFIGWDLDYNLVTDQIYTYYIDQDKMFPTNEYNIADSYFWKYGNNEIKTRVRAKRKKSNKR